MFKVKVVYPDAGGLRFDHANYRDKHMTVVKARLGRPCALRDYAVEKGVAGGAAGAPPAYVALPWWALWVDGGAEG